MSNSFRLGVEHLEDRRVLSSVWQASPNPLDVDSSGLVIPLDVLLVVNDINANGKRVLPANRPDEFAGPLCDVNGDGLLSPLDVLLVVNAINKYPDAPRLNVNLTTQSDPNGDEVVLSSSVVYQGVTTADSVLRIDFLESSQPTSSMEIVVDENGSFETQITLPQAVNHLRFTVTDVRGRTVATERIARSGNVLVAWNAALLEMVRETTNVLSSGVLLKPPPPMVAKYMAMVHGAMFDAMNAIERTYHGYAFDEMPEAAASPIAAAAAAAHRVASHIYPTAHEIEFWDKTLAETLTQVPDGIEKDNGIALGIRAADAMIALRADDGSTAESSYATTEGPGRWKPTLPSFSPPTLPHWSGVTPFALESGDQFRPAPPPPLSSAAYALAVDEVLRLGSAQSTQRTADQTEIATFWADGGGTSTPPGHWNQIAADVGLSRGLSLLESARLFALLNYAMADAGIASWDAKYGYDLWRPIDAIREANSDGNPSTSAVVDWAPLLTTPSFPTYTSGHSTFSGAAAAALSALLGDDISFESMADRGSTGLWPPSDDVSALAVRSFTSFWEAAEEAGVSRIYGGIHFSFDNTAGLDAGGQVGQWVVDRLLPLRT